MGIFTLPAASTSAAPSLNWTLISTSTPSSVSTLSLTSIATTYSKLYVVMNLSVSGSGSYVTFNNDTDNNYFWSAIAIKSSNALGGSGSGATSSILISPGIEGGADASHFVIHNANTTSLKTVEGWGSNNAPYMINFSGGYRASAAISRIDFNFPATLNSSGSTVWLYGVSA